MSDVIFQPVALLGMTGVIATLTLKKGTIISSLILGHRATCMSKLKQEKEHLTGNKAGVIQMTQSPKHRKQVPESPERRQWLQLERAVHSTLHKSLGAQENSLSTQVMKWSISVEEGNSPHFEGDQSSPSGSSENIAELCSSGVVLAGYGFRAAKALGHEKRLMMNAAIF